MIFLCKLNIFFIFNNLLLVFTADSLTNEENGKKSSDEMIIFKFKDGIKQISTKYLKEEYSILVDDKVLNKNEIELSCLNMNILETFKILKKLYEDNIYYKKNNNKEFLKDLFKDITFRRFTSFLKIFGEKNFVINKLRFLTYVGRYIQIYMEKNEEPVKYFNTQIENNNYENISEFIYIFSYFKKEIILQFRNVKCYITIDSKINNEENKVLGINYNFKIYQNLNDPINYGSFDRSCCYFLDFLEGLVDFYKKDMQNSKFFFNVIFYSKGEDVLEYGNEFINGLKKIVNENNTNENLKEKRFNYNSEKYESGFNYKKTVYQFNLQESNGEEWPNIKFLVCKGYVFVPAKSVLMP